MGDFYKSKLWPKPDRNTTEYQNLIKRVKIQNKRGKQGAEVGDTTIVIFSELTLHAALENFKERIVDWYWADTTYSTTSPIYLGEGDSIAFRPTKADTGFIYSV